VKIETVIENLERTIEGKRFYLSTQSGFIAKIIELNIKELEDILADLKNVS